MKNNKILKKNIHEPTNGERSCLKPKKREYSSLSFFFKSKKNGVLLYNSQYVILCNENYLNNLFFNIGGFKSCLIIVYNSILNCDFSRFERLTDDSRVHIMLLFRFFWVILSCCCVSWIFLYIKLILIPIIITITIFIIYILTTLSFTNKYLTKLSVHFFVCILFAFISLFIIYIPLFAYISKYNAEISSIDFVLNILNNYLTGEFLITWGTLPGSYMLNTDGDPVMGPVMTLLRERGMTNFGQLGGPGGSGGPGGPIDWAAGVLILLDIKPSKNIYAEDWGDRTIAVQINDGTVVQVRDVEPQVYSSLYKKYGVTHDEVKRFIVLQKTFISRVVSLETLIENASLHKYLPFIFQYPMDRDYKHLNPLSLKDRFLFVFSASRERNKSVNLSKYYDTKTHPAYGLASLGSILMNNKLPEFKFTDSPNTIPFKIPKTPVVLRDIKAVLSPEVMNFITRCFNNDPRTFKLSTRQPGSGVDDLIIVGNKEGWFNVNKLLRIPFWL